MRKSLPLAIFAAGFTAIISQIVFIRELLTVFYGNELSIAFILASWLIGGAIGSLLLAPLAERIRSQSLLLAFSLIVLGAILPLNILAIRSIRPLFSVNPGEIIAYSPILVSSFIILVPVCALLGFIFTLGCRLYKDSRGRRALGIGVVYVLEALGAMAGGMLANFVLIPLSSSLQIMVYLAMLLSGLSIALAAGSGRSIFKVLAIGLAGSLLLFQGFAHISGLWQRLDSDSIGRQWQGYQLLRSKNTIYGNLSAVKNLSQYSFFENGLHLYTIPGGQSAEEAAHFAMLAHKEPKKVLLLGGGLGGTLEEILKHGIDRVDYIELDPMIFKIAKEELPPEYYRHLEDSRVRLFFEDGRSYVKRSAELYDVIIIGLGEPYNAQINRFYTVEFYNEAKRILREGGVLSFGLGASESYLSVESKDFLASIYVTLRASFADVYMVPGDTAYFLATDGKGLFIDYYRNIMKRAEERLLSLRYITEENLFPRFSAGSADFLHRSLAEARHIEINLDFRPISYYYDIVCWSSRFKDNILAKLMKSIDVVKVTAGSVIAVVVIGLFAFMSPRSAGSIRRATMAAVAANGFSQITFQVLILLAFQIFYGYMFYKLGVIITAFMAGLALGGYAAVRSMSKVRDERRSVILIQTALTIYPVALLAALGCVRIISAGQLRWVGSELIFIALPILSGFIGGALFPIAGKIIVSGKRDAGIAGGINYGTDLVGACIGALLGATIFVPILGIPVTCIVAAAVNSAVLLSLVLSRA